MKKNEQLKLIAGNFNGDEAKEILMNIFSAKIQFHKIKNFITQEKNGVSSNTASSRISELQTEIKKIEEITTHAKHNNKMLSIQAIVEVELLH